MGFARWSIAGSQSLYLFFGGVGCYPSANVVTPINGMGALRLPPSGPPSHALVVVEADAVGSAPTPLTVSH